MQPTIPFIETNIIQKLSIQRLHSISMRYGAAMNFVTVDPHPSVTTIHDVILFPGLGINISNSQHHYQTSEYLMLESSPTFISDLVSSFGFTNLHDTIDVFYNLLWHINSYPDPFATNLALDEIAYISGLTINHLLTLFPNNLSNRAIDKASLLYAAISGKSLPHRDINFAGRYQEVAKYPPPVIWRLANIRWNINNIDRNGEEITYSPYELVAAHAKDTIEDIFLVATTDNVFDLINKYGIIIPDQTNSREILRSFLEQISEYDAVFARSPNILPPPRILETEDIQLGQYTTKELVDAYEPVGSWTNRNELIDLIIKEGKGGALWDWRHRYCKNDDTMNVTEFELHGDMNKDDPNDPTLSYGLQSNYRCYQVSELITMFTQYPNGFRVPDYHYENIGIDPTTKTEYAQEFPLESIKQLRALLQNPPIGYHLGNLPDLIDKGLRLLDEDMMKMERMKSEYDLFNAGQQYLANLFIAWIFLYGMWMRFWKGPGYPWAYDASDLSICIPVTRDEHVFIQHDILAVLTESIEKDPILRDWINRLPIAAYNFQTDRGSLRNETVMKILGGYILGTQCLGYGGDRFVQTGYYLITQLLRWNKEGEFDKFIASMLPSLLDIEKQIVNQQLTRHRGDINSDTYRVLTERRNELNKPIRLQARFDSKRVVANKHIE